MDYRKLGNSALSFLLAFVMVMTPLLSAAEPVIAEEAEESSKTEYVFENDDLKAEAVLSEASSIPDDADFKVSQITEKTDRDSYDAYMKALNKGTDISYDSTNTLLYDFAFIKDGAEIEPEEGKVSVSVQFKKSQLVKGIGAENETDFHVIHLPVKDTDEIKVSDIKKEELSSSDVDIDASKEEVKFVTESFSTFAYSTANAGSDGSVTVNVNLQKNGSNVSSAQIDSGKYFVYIEGPARRASDGQQQTGFLLAPLTDAGNGVATLKINDLGQNGSAFGPMIDGQNYTLKLYRLQDGKTARNIYQSGQPDQNDYKEVTGDLMLTAGSKSYKPEVPSTLTLSNGEIIINAQESKNPNAVDYGDFTDKISIVNINTVLGRAVEYGILADTFRQTAHTETNWAVNLYDRTDAGLVTDPDLGTNTEHADDTGYPFIMTQMTRGFRVGSTTVGTMSIYTSDEYAGHNELFTADTANVTLKKYFRDRSVLKADVDAMIGKIRDESDALAAKNTITVPDGAIGNNNHFTIDTTGYADDDVIYVSVPAGSKLEEIIKTTEGLTIKKSANQMVVFNFETEGEVNINKIAVEVDGKRITSDTVNQQLDNEHNKDVDNYIIRKIIWNANQASKLNVDMGAGMFLVPRGDAHCQNASAGWLATGGTVTANGEWHFAFRQRQFMTDGSIKFEGRKELVSYKDDGTAVRLPISQNQFKFTLYQTDDTYDTTGSATEIVQEHLGNSATSAVQFQDLGIKEADLEYDAATGKYTKVLYYVVREELPDGTVPELYSSQSVNGIDYWTGDLRVKITATLNKAPEGSGGEDEIQFTVSSWKYDSNGTLLSNNNEIVATTQVFTFGAFPNETSDKKVSLKATKSFTGKTWDNETFKFKLDKVSATGTDGASIPEDQIPMPDHVTETVSSSHQTAIFGAMEYNLPGTYVYTITELPPDGTEVPEGTTSVTVDGITYDLAPHTVTVTVTQTADGALEASADYGDGTSGLTVTNTYSSQHTELSFMGTKSITGRLFQAGDSFTFRVSAEGNAPLPTDKNGNEVTAETVSPIIGTSTVNFILPLDASIKYTDEDLGKTYTYTVTEEATISGVTNDARVHTVTVTITKDNDGKLVATPTYSDGNKLIFINNYHANEVSIGLSGTKTWNKLLEGNDFSFTITEVADQEGTPIQPAEGETVYTETVRNDEDGNFTFSDITFYEVGTHYYKVVEENAGQKVNGTTHDSRSYITKIVVTDDGQGSLRAELDDTASNIKFSNTYEAAGDVELEAKKVLNGRDLKAGEFSFQLKDSDGKVIQTKQNAADGTVKFDEISYTYADLDKSPIKYTISEVKGSLGGVKYDEHTEEIEVTLTDNGDGTITATPNKTGAEVEFKNEYSAEGSAVVGAKKVLSGKALTANQFQFQLLAADKTTVLQTKSNAEDGTVTFDTIEYSLKDVKNSPITYYIKEVPGSDAAYSYDPELKAVTVTLNDDGDGHISTHVNPSSDSIVFSNTYGADGEVRLEALKVQTGKTLKGGEYSFELKDANGAVLQTKTNDADGKVVFDAITYNQDDLANSPFTYTINEVKGDKAGIKYDEHVETITVTLKDKGGKIEATPNKNGAQVKFENEYKAEGEVQLKAKKVLTGKTLPEGEFTFELKDSTGKVLQSKTNAEDGTVTFDKISYTEEDLAKSPIKYTISERAGDKPYYTYDDHEVEVNVTLEDDDEDGNITVVPDKTEAEVKFENEYKAEGEVQLKAKKVLTGKTLPEGEFTFELKDSTGKVLQSKTNAEDGTVTFDKISYTEEDLVKSPIEYTISERAGDKPYYTYDNHEETITVALEDNGNGTITATPNKTGAQVEFKNNYTASGKVRLEAKKVLNGSTLKAGEFTFQLKDEAGKVISEVTNAVDGTVTFGEISYSLDDIKNSPIKYTISEKAGDKPYYTYDNHEETITVALEDNGNGTITATPNKTGAQVEFKNNYTASGKVQLEARKVLNGRDLKDKEFTFELKDATGKVLQSKTNAADGTVKFDEIEYDLDDVKNSPIEYTISESKGNDKSITYDSDIENVKVFLTDDGKGTITASPDRTGAEIEFENEYTASGKVQLEAKKVLNGRDLKDKEFTFELKDATGKVLQSKTNAADGTVKFDEIEYSLDDIKNSPIEYTISEVKGSLGGITYAENEETISVELVDNGEGTIIATPDKNGAAVKFTNDYHAKGKVVLVARKTLDGKTLEAGKFAFDLKDSTGKLLQEVTNAADGTVTFDEIKYTEADLKNSPIKYTINEVDGKEPGYTYDTTPREISVTLTDKGDGEIEAVASPKAAEVTFANTYGAAGQVQLKALKVLKGKDLTGGEFEFALKDETGKVVQTKTNDASGKVIFDPITYSQNDLVNSPFTYRITEVKGNKSYYTYDTHEETIEVTLEDKGGRIEATPNKTEAQVKFENEYTASGKVQLEAKKVLNGRDLKDKEFTFELKDATGKVLQSKTNAADGTVKFDEIEYSLDDVKKSPITYTISEVKGSLGGITYAENKETINVELTDNGNGTITATPDKNGTAVKFVNDYHADATDAQFKVSKKTTGQTGSTKTFEFTIKPVSEDAKDTEKADKYTSEGTVSVTGAADKEFDKITYSAEGTYEYEISETKGDAKGYTYDRSVYKAVVTVTDNETGQLQKEVKVTKIKDSDGNDIPEEEQTATDKATVDFDNKYKADSTEVKFSIQKELKDARSTDKEFSFRLEAADENAEKVLEQDDVKSTTGAGIVDFDTIEFDETGTYTFKITEDEKQYNDFIFDKSEYTAVVKITDNDSGELQKDVKITKTKDSDGKEIAEPEEVDGLTVTFTNTRKKAKLLLTKTIDKYYDAGDKTNASMVFTVTYKDADGNTVSRNANVQYDADSDTTQIVEMDDIPLDTDLEITETYSGNYKPVEGTKTLTKDDVRLIDGEYVYTVTFENRLVNSISEQGIINKYEKDADGNFVIKHRVGIDE